MQAAALLALRRLAMEALWKAARLLAMCLFGAGLLISGCSMSSAVATRGAGVHPVPAPGGGFVFVPDQRPIDLNAVPITGTIVSDAQRYQLAIAAGFTADEAILATALSIAEDGSGVPDALSPANRDGSRDFCLWQVNSGWWPQFGGQAALAIPANCAAAAYYIFRRQGWCAWSTYEASCGPGHNGAYRAYLACARAVSVGAPCIR